AQMAKDYVEEMLGQNERILLRARKHWSVLFGNIILEIVLIIALVVISILLAPLVAFPVLPLGFALVLVPLVGMVRDVLLWYNRQYVVSNRRVIQTSGVFSKDVVDSSLEKVNDVKLSQSFWGRLFDYGDIEILTASEVGANVFRSIGDPIRFKTAMLNAKERLEFGNEMGAPSTAMADIPSLIARLDDLRKKGLISEAEFQQKKTELLAKM
ncbi:MAG: PH domain-containing protein, partial [Chloroflexota bacterium]|nr:PH domain-containing protein [Chloroflexota bacterium]